jgi:hypothetical protein
MRIPNFNARQWQLIYQSLLGMAGPLAKFISLFFGTDEALVKSKIDAVLDLVAVLTPIISLVWITATSKNTDLVKHVAAIPPDEKAAAVSAVPPSALASMVEAMPEQVVVAAAGAMPGVDVKVDPSEAPAGAVQAAKDATVPGVNLA